MSGEEITSYRIWVDMGLVEKLPLLALAAVVLGLFVWAAFVRKPEPERPHQHRHHWRQPKPGAEKSSKRSRNLLGLRRRERRRRKQRPRNATLAETGGLPAHREDSPEPPLRPL